MHILFSHHDSAKGRSLIDLALNGKKKPDIVRYLIVEKKLSVKDSNNTPLLLNAIDNYIRQSNITETEQLKGSPPVLVIDEEQSSVSTSLNDQVSFIISYSFHNIMICIADELFSFFSLLTEVLHML